MPDGTVEALKQAIASLEQDLARHRAALRLLEGRDANTPTSNRPQQSRPAQRSAAAARRSSALEKKSAQPARAARSRGGQKQSKAHAPQPSASQLIRSVLSNQSGALTPAEIVKALTQRGHAISADNVHRRLSDMTKSKAVIRNAGKYTIGK